MMRYLCAIGSNMDAPQNLGRMISALLFPGRSIVLSRIVCAQREDRSPDHEYLCALACFVNDEGLDSNKRRLQTLQHYQEQSFWWRHGEQAGDPMRSPIDLDLVAIGRWYLHGVGQRHPHLEVLQNDFTTDQDPLPADVRPVELPWNLLVGDTPDTIMQIPGTGEIERVGCVNERFVNGLYSLDQ